MEYTKKLFGQKTIVNFLKNLKNCSHAIILSSQDEITMQSVAKLFVISDCCQQKDKPCFECLSCKKILDGNAIDVEYFGLDKNILVDDSKKIVSDSFILPLELPKKYFILNNFDLATTQAQNKLLKVIEEPQHSVQFVLMTKNLDAVLPTIKSRCEIYKMPKLNSYELNNVFYIGDESTVQTETMLNYACGNLTKLVQVSNDKQFLDLYALAINVLIILKNSAQILEFSTKIINFKSDITQFLNILLSLYGDVLQIENGNEQLVDNKQIINELKIASNSMSLLSVVKIIQQIEQSLQELKFNVCLSGIVDNLLLKILEIKYICK